MIESKFTQRLLKALRTEMPGAIILKHSDRYTGGMPDFSITREGRTTWCEVKVTTQPGTGSKENARMFEPLQFETCKRMRAYYLIWCPPLKQGYLFQTQELLNSAWYELESYTFDEMVEKIKVTF